MTGHIMKTNEVKIEGCLESLSDPIDLILGNSEGEKGIQHRDFIIHTDCGLVLPATARSDVGSAFHLMRVDARCRDGVHVEATGYLISGLTTIMLVAKTIRIDTSQKPFKIK